MAGQRSILAKYANINPEEIRGNIYLFKIRIRVTDTCLL